MNIVSLRICNFQSKAIHVSAFKCSAISSSSKTGPFLGLFARVFECPVISSTSKACSGSKASLSIMQFHFPSNIVPATSGAWAPCNFTFFQTKRENGPSGLVVWAPCNFTFFQAFKTLNVGYNLFKILEINQLFEYHAILLPYNAVAHLDVWEPCNFTPFQTGNPSAHRKNPVWTHVISRLPNPRCNIRNIFSSLRTM